MGLFDLFRQLVREEEEDEAPDQPAGKGAEDNELEIYSGMRVEVSTFDGRVLFVAKLMSLWGSTGQLHQYSEAPPLKEGEESLRVRIRGYNDRERKAVYMEGTISPLPQSKWKVEELVVARVGNDRAFFRLDTDMEATVTTFTGLNPGEKPARLLNISVGGACVAAERQFYEGDKFLLKVKLLEEREPSVIYCQVLRIIDRGEGRFEYGCRFLELNEADQDRITENIFAVQRQNRNRGR